MIGNLVRMWGGPEPLVSCLMVTQSKRWADGPPPGFRSFVMQTYGTRELVIVSKDPCEAMADAALAFPDSVRFFDVAEEAPETLGDLRNVAVDCAAGMFVATWDDDDVSSPDRLAEQVAALRVLTAGDACTLLRVGMEDVRRGKRFVSPRASWPMTMLARRESMEPYPPLQVCEDLAVLDRFRRLVVLDRPELYTYRINHGDNVAARDWWAEEIAEDSRLQGGAK